MAKIARIADRVDPAHEFERGNNPLPVFFVEEDYRYYLNTLTEVLYGMCSCMRLFSWYKPRTPSYDA